MKIEQKSLAFKCLLAYEKEVDKNSFESLFKQLEELAFYNGFYRTGPFFLMIDESKPKKITYYTPINDSIQIKDKFENFSVVNNFNVEEALSIKYIGESSDYVVAYKKLKAYAKENGIMISKQFYCVFLELFDEIVVEVYAPITRGEV